MSRARRAVSWLYVPATQPDRFDKAVRSGADLVILDLEDSVLPSRKDEARANALAYLTERHDRAKFEVRVNAVGTAAGTADLAALSEFAELAAIRLPSVESAQQVQAALDLLGDRHRVHCTIESALGVEHAYEIATLSPAVRSIGLGEADLSADLGVDGGESLAFARSRIVVAARAAGLAAPAMSVYPAIDDDEGLAAHCRVGRRLGFFGCAAVHPRQLPVIRAAFTPSEAEVAAARAVLAALAAGTADGRGAVRTDDGRMVDAAMRRSAEDIIALAEPDRDSDDHCSDDLVRRTIAE